MILIGLVKRKFQKAYLILVLMCVRQYVSMYKIHCSFFVYCSVALWAIVLCLRIFFLICIFYFIQYCIFLAF